MTEDEIRDLFRKHDVPLSRSEVWKVQSAYVIKHSALERLAASLGIRFDPPTIIRAESDEAVMIVRGTLGEVTDWATGEAKIGLNYQVSGKQAGYPWAMSEKRGRDRVTLKLARLYGAYSEDESDTFKQPQAPQDPIKAPPAPPERNVLPMEPPPVKRGPGRPPKAVIPPPPREPEELFEWEDRETGELRHVTEAELHRLEARPQITPEQKKANAALSANPAVIPQFLKRLPPEEHPDVRNGTAVRSPTWPSATHDPDAWLKRLDTELAKLTDGDTMQELWERIVEPVARDLFPPDLEEAQNIMRHHTRKVEP